MFLALLINKQLTQGSAGQQLVPPGRARGLHITLGLDGDDGGWGHWEPNPGA